MSVTTVNEELQDIRAAVMAMQSVMGAMLFHLVLAKVLDRDDYIKLLTQSEERVRRESHSAAAVAVYRNLRHMLGDIELESEREAAG
jgi:hypothetical protein